MSPTVTRMRLPVAVVTVILAVFLIFILAGGVYDVLERPISLLPSPSGGYSVLIKGTLQQQTLNESIISAVLYVLGFGGLYMLLRSTGFAYRPRNAYLLLILGTLTVLVAIFYSNSLITSKISS